MNPSSRLIVSATTVAALPLASPCMAAAPFTVVVLPDTQNYTNTAAANEEYNLGQTRWIRDNRVSQNIKFVLHVGDLQNPGNPYFARTDDIYEPDFTRPTGFIADDTRFRRADAAIDILDAAGVPYSIAPGNHDYLKGSGQYERQEPIYYLKYFGPQRYAGKPTFGGSSPADPVLPYAGMNTYHKFEGNGYTFLNIALQFDPNNHDLRWAQKIINENPGLPTIIHTHAYLNNSGYQPGYQNIWDEFVKLNPQIVMTVNGHITGEHRLTDTNIAGQQVHQMLVDYQGTDFPGLYVGGGYLRRMEFDTDNNVVRVKSYSPIANNFLTDGDSQFNLPINFTQRFGLPNGAGVKASVSFRQGVNGYTGGRDTYLDASAPDTNFGSATIAWVDSDRAPGTAGQQQAHGMIRFNDLFAAGGIPAGAIIRSAELVIHTSSLPDSQSGNTMSLHRLLGGWVEDSATWNSQGSGISANAADAIYAANDAVVPDAADEFLTFDVTESLWAWAAGAPNEGWALLPGSGGNGWRWDTAEAGEIFNRPMLNVDFTLADPLVSQWNAGSGNWTDSAGWVGGVPGGASSAVIAFSTFGATVNVSTDVADIFSLSIGNGNVLSIGSGGDVRNTGQTWDDPQYAFRIGDGSAGTVLINNGMLANVANWMTALQGADIYVGVGAGGNGTITQGGASSLVQGREVRIGSGGGAVGLYNLNGGTLNANQLRVGSGNGSAGQFNFQSGNANVAIDAYIGVDGGTGTAAQTGGTLSVTRYLIVGSGSGGGVFSDGTFNQQGGTVTIGSELLIGLGGASGRYHLAGGTLNAGRITNGGTFEYTGGAANIGELIGTGAATIGAGVNLTVDRVTQSTANVDGTITVRPNGDVSGVSRINNINLGAAGKINLTDNKLISAMPAGTWDGSAYASVAGMVDSGRGDAGNALWDGSGIVTSDTRAIGNGDLLSIGVANVGDVRNIGDSQTTLFAGQIIPGSDTIAMVTWGGDANLDGKINIDDYGRIDGNVGQSGSVFGWSRGDFNYDGKINIDDYGIIDGNINRQGTPFVTTGVAVMDEVSAVPEPASAMVVSGLWGAMLCARKRRGRL